MRPLALEQILGRFCQRVGLYIVGAGASAGDIPVGERFIANPGVLWLRDLSGFSASVTPKLLLTRNVARLAGDTPLGEIFPGREIRSGTDTFLIREILMRLPDWYTRAMMKHTLAAPAFSRRRSDSYRVFRLFRPATIANYNHDGLLGQLVGRRHRIINMHGVVDPRYGSPEMRRLIERCGEFDGIPIEPDNLIMCVAEENDGTLVNRLIRVTLPPPEFLAIIGYSFARNGQGFDDNVSLEFFRERFREFRGPIYVFEPNPGNLQNATAMIADTFRARNVIGIPVFWNVLAHAYLQNAGAIDGRSVNWRYQRLLDQHRGPRSFP